MEEKRPIALLTTYSAISAGVAAGLLTIGFVIHVRLTQLLGIDLPNTPADYFAAAGDFFLSLLVRSFGIFNRDVTMSRQLVVASVLALLALTIGLVLRRSEPTGWRRRLPHLCFLFMTGSAIVLLTWTMSLLRLRNVLQPANETHTVHQLQALPVPDPNAVARLVVDAYKHESSSLQDTVGRVCFNPSSGNTAEHRQNLYAGTILTASLLVFAALVTPPGAATWLRTSARWIVWLSILITLPLAYATLGRNFTYPIVRITNGSVTYCGYLLAADTSSVTLYDRPAGFRLRRVPREHLLIDQVGAASPFQACDSARNDPQGFVPCETLFCTP